MAPPTRPEIHIFRDAAVIWKNFAGAQKQYNPEGKRNFNLLLDANTAEELMSQQNQWGDTWKIKPRKRNADDGEDYGPPEYTLEVAVSFQVKPPRIWLITSSGRTMLGEGFINMLDDLDALKVDLTLTGYDWMMKTGTHGRKAYLDTMFYTMYENPLELEYSTVPQIAVAGGEMPAIEAGSRQQFDYEGEEV